MAVPVQQPYVTYAANGVASVYSIPFRLIRSDDLKVYLNGMRIVSGYVISGLNNNTATITFSVPPAVGVLLLQRDVPLQRLTDYQTNGDLLAATINLDFDRIWMALQGLFSQLSSSIRVPFPETVDPIPKAADRANRLLSFDSFGRPIAAAPVGGSATALALQLASSSGSSQIGHGSTTVAEALDDLSDGLFRADTLLDITPAFIEQFITGLHGRGMLAAETPNQSTEQPLTSNAAAGAATISVANNVVFTVGGCITIRHDNGKYATYFIEALGGGGTTIGFRPGLRWNASSAVAAVERTWYNNAHPGKFYMRELAQRVVDTPQFAAAMPCRGRSLFTQLDSNPNNYFDILNGVAGGTVAYFDETNIGQGNIANPVEFNIGRAAFITVPSAGAGAETNLFPVNGETQCILRFVGMCRGTTTEVDVKVVDNLGRNSVVFRMPTGVSQRIPQVYSIPFKVAGDATSLKVQFVATVAPAPTSIIVDQIEVFESDLYANPLIPLGKKCTVVMLGDSWVTGNQPAQPEREGMWRQVQAERPDAVVINSGVGGNTIRSMIARFDADVAAHNPQYVVVNTGTNDSYSPSSAVFFPNAVDNFNADYNRLIAMIQAIGAKPIIIGVPALCEQDGAFVDFELNNRAKTYSRYFCKNWAIRKPRPYPLLGAVSQSGGFPTGAIMEKGGDEAGGYYLMYADGRLECVRTVTINMSSTTNQVFTYPKPSVSGFSAGYASLFSLNSETTQAAFSSHTLRCTDNSWIFRVNTAGTANETVRLVMTGRWY